MKQILIAVTMLTSPLVLAKDKRTRIAVLDTGITSMGKIINGEALCKDGHSRNHVNNENGRHGTNVVSLIANKLNTNKFCIEIHNILGAGTKLKDEWKGLSKSLDAKFVNMSFAGPGQYKIEKRFLKLMLKKGIHVFVAAGNNNRNIDKKPVYPAGYGFKSKFFHVVGSTSTTLSGKKYSNFGSTVTDWQDGTHKGLPKMTGTSQATPIALNKLIRGIK